MIDFFALHETLFLIIAIFSGLFYFLSVHHIMLEGLNEKFLRDRTNFDLIVVCIFYLTRLTLVISTLLLLTDLFLRA